MCTLSPLLGLGVLVETRLALQVVDALENEFTGGVYYIPLAPVSDSKLIVPLIAQTLGLHKTVGQAPWRA